MTITPTFSMQSCRVLASLIDAFETATGWSDVALANAAGKSRSTINVIRNWNGANAAPNFKSTVAIEAVIRDHFVPGDAQASEKLYRTTLARLVKEAGYSGGTFTMPRAE